jgi:hypothetical protein
MNITGVYKVLKTLHPDETRSHDLLFRDKLTTTPLVGVKVGQIITKVA